jgi:hypothetical protein
MGVAANVGTCADAAMRVSFPLIVATSGPYMRSARLASSGVTGQFRMKPWRSIRWNSDSLGRPILRYNSLAASAASISRLVNIFFVSDTTFSKVTSLKDDDIPVSWTYKPDGCSWNSIFDPSHRCTVKEVESLVSMVIRQTFRTAANDRMFAMDSGLYHTGPKLGRSPIMYDSW